MASYRAPRIIGWITRVLFSLFIFSICGILIWRVFISAKIPKSIDTLAPNAKLTEAYEATDGNLTLRYQELSTISRSSASSFSFKASSVSGEGAAELAEGVLSRSLSNSLCLYSAP